MLMCPLTGLLVTALAASQVVETVHHGSIFQWLRDWADGALNSKNAFVRFVANLLACPFCFSHWASAAMVFFLVAGWFVTWWAFVPIWILAVTRLANIAHDLARPVSRLSDDAGPGEQERVETSVVEIV